MDNKKCEEWLKKVKETTRQELSPEELENVSGGVAITQNEAVLRQSLALAQQMNLSLQDVQGMVPQLKATLNVGSSITEQEATNFFQKNWTGVVR